MWLKNVRYLDYNAGSGLSDLVRKKLIIFLGDEAEAGFVLANPSSRHRLGQRVGHHLYQAKRIIAASLQAHEDSIIFTSSGTESNQTVIHSLAQISQGAILGAGEHSATIETLPALHQKLSFTRVLPLLPNGQYDFSALEILIDEASKNNIQNLFLSLAWANNETGVLLDLAKLKTIIEKSPVKILLHLDGAQAWGKVPVNVQESGADYITFTGHKIGAPAGVGIIWKKPTAPFNPLVLGSQQQGQRGGTENSLGIIALGFAAEQISPEGFAQSTKPLRDRLEEKLKAAHSRIRVWGEDSPRLPNTARIGFKGFQKYQNWVELLDIRGFAVSHGSACKSQIIEPSRVLLAMGASHEEALNSIRISLGTHNTIEDIDLFVDTLLNMNSLKEATNEAADEA